MRKHSKTKYIHGHGYIRVHGDGLGDIFSSIFKAGSQVLTKIPSKLIDASKSALINAGSSTIKAVGSKVGDTIANKIVSKNVKPTPVSDQEVRRQVLKELTFEKPVVEPTQESNSEGISGELYKKMYGSGRKRSKQFIGAGIKIL